jgi:hypothetical protein
MSDRRAILASLAALAAPRGASAQGFQPSPDDRRDLARAQELVGFDKLIGDRSGFLKVTAAAVRRGMLDVLRTGEPATAAMAALGKGGDNAFSALLAAFAAWGFDALWKRNFVNQVAFELLNQIRWEPNQLWSAIGIIFAVGALTGAIGSGIAVSRFLRV